MHGYGRGLAAERPQAPLATVLASVADRSSQSDNGPRAEVAAIVASWTRGTGHAYGQAGESAAVLNLGFFGSASAFGVSY